MLSLSSLITHQYIFAQVLQGMKSGEESDGEGEGEGEDENDDASLTPRASFENSFVDQLVRYSCYLQKSVAYMCVMRALLCADLSYCVIWTQRSCSSYTWSIAPII